MASKMNPELASAIIASAKRLGVDPVHLATTISYETGGTWDQNKWGGKNNNHLGYIQFGEPERAKYGVKEGQTATEQMGAVENYLRDRGVRPGMGLMDVYSAVNAGAPGLYNRSDANNGGAPGTVADKVNSQMEGHRMRAEELLGMGAPVGALAMGPPAPPMAGAPVGTVPAPVPGAPLDITAQAPVGALSGITPQALAGLSAKLGGDTKPEEFAPLQKLQIGQAPMMGQSQQIAAALAKAYGIGV